MARRTSTRRTPARTTSAGTSPAKKESDIFICESGGDYWAYPSPFVAHGNGAVIQFRNLTGDAIEIGFGNAPLDPKTLPLAKDTTACVRVQGARQDAGLYEYEAEVRPSTTRRQRRRILVKGGSPPRIIVDT